MKKTLLIVLIFFFNFQGFSQNGALFQTWYLTSYEVQGVTYPVSSITPHITPDLVIEPNLIFSGYAACNNYLGEFIYDNVNGFLVLDFFDATLNLCDYQSHDDFETTYFSFLNNTLFSYNIVYGTEGEEYLELESDSGSIFYYQNSPLIFYVNDQAISNIYLYPNPAISILYVSNENVFINNFIVYSITGKKVLEILNKNNSIDVSTLSKGMYFIEIISVKGKTVKKFIKK